MQDSPTDRAKVVPITPQQVETFRKPTISSQLPVHYENGYILDVFEGACSVCGGKVAAKDLHGSIVQPIKSITVIEAVGLCRTCKIAVPFFMRIKDDGTTQTRDARGNWIIGMVDEKDKGITPAEKVIALLASAVLLIGFAWLIG